MGLMRAARAVSGFAAASASAAIRPVRAVSGVLAVMVGRPRLVRRRAAIRAAKPVAKPDTRPGAVAATEAAIKASVAAALPPGWMFDIVTDRVEELRCWRYTLYARPPGDKQEWACDALVDDRHAFMGDRHASDASARVVAKLGDAAEEIARKGDFREAPLGRSPDYPDVVPAYGQACYAGYPDRIAATMSFYPDRVPVTMSTSYPSP